MLRRFCCHLFCKQDPGKLVHGLVKYAQGASDGVRLGEINARDLQLFERIIAAAGCQEAEIAGSQSFLTAHNP